MRQCRLLLVLLAVLALAGCANSRYAANVRAAKTETAHSALDEKLYGGSQTAIAAASQASPAHKQSTPISQPQVAATAPKPQLPASAQNAMAAELPISAAAVREPVSPLAFLFQPRPRPSYVVAQARQIISEPERPYTLDSGDRLRIVVFGQDSLSNNYIVDAEGRISFPLVGTVRARGSTASQLAGSIRTALANGFIREPNVSVEVETHRPFFVMGEVTYPGLYPYVPGMTVENAVAIAGGFTPRGYKDDAIVTRKFDGMPVRQTMPIRTTPVRPGDIITVKERWF
jgi:polysaccharide export outer membrane protein